VNQKNKHAICFRFQLSGALLLLTGASSLPAQRKERVETIMARVAENQDRTQEQRSTFVYQQNLLIRFKRGNGKICREEVREFTVTPSARGTQKKLTLFRGKYLRDGALIEYSEPGYTHKGLDLDGELITDFADDFANDKDSRDGISREFFPLTSREQKKYRFEYKGQEIFKNREAFKIAFKPLDKSSSKQTNSSHNEDSGPWTGDILVDKEEFQPMLVTTHLAHGIPFLVKTLLGTNIQHLGFKVEYDRIDDNLWFPVKYGGEFRLKAVFLYKRTMALALQNSGFQKAQVTTTWEIDEAAEKLSVPMSDSAYRSPD
jgi:hypothetical protein